MKKISKKTKWILLAIVIVLIIIATLFNFFENIVHNVKIEVASKNGKIDDWEFDNSSIVDYTDSSLTSKSGFLFGGTMIADSAVSLEMSADSSTNIGFSTGGAKDINNFRENIENGYFPISTDITYNGLFYDYSFDTGRKNESNALFSPSYSTAISKDPISGEDEYYMTVGLNSNIKESDFKRKKLNLVVVLDISGSMSSSLSDYYYDSDENIGFGDEAKSKMELANESVNILIDQLNEDDRFGMVLFDDQAYLGKEMTLIGDTNVEAIKDHILEIQDNGGTNFEAGYKKATELYDEFKNIDSNEYENRIIVITDAMPNCGTTSKDGLTQYIQENADDGIYTTFIGVGVDFNTEVIEALSDVKGANYYSVNTASEFKEQMGEQFEYMVTPLVFDLKLCLKSDGYEIESVYGSDTVNAMSGEIMNVNTLFPSKTNSDGEVKGGVVLLKLKKLNENDSSDIKLSVEYKDRNGVQYSNQQNVIFENSSENYENSGIRKAIVLIRYANVLKNWILYERFETPRCIINEIYGIKDCDFVDEDDVYQILGENERSSVELTVSDEYKEVFEQFRIYLEEEINQIGDKTMEQELDIIDEIIN